MQYKKYIKEILPIDLITLVYILITAFYIIFGAAKLHDVTSHLFWRINFLGIIIVLIYLNSIFKNKAIEFFRNFYVLGFLAYFYPETDSLNNLFFFDLDPYIANLELTIFGSRSKKNKLFKESVSG